MSNEVEVKQTQQQFFDKFVNLEPVLFTGVLVS